MTQLSMFGDDDTLSNAKEKWNKVIAKDGGYCPCCGKWGKVYRIKLSQHLALSLRWIMLNADEMGWTKVQEKAPRWMLKSKTYTLLEHWGLIEAKSHRSGVWRVTPQGTDFVLGLINMDSAVYIYDNKVYGWSGEMTSFRGCFGKHFDFDEMMSERFDWAAIKLR